MIKTRHISEILTSVLALFDQPLRPSTHLPHSTATSIRSRVTGLVTEATLVARVAQTLPAAWVTAAVGQVTVTPAVTGGSPPPWLTLTGACPLVTGQQEAVTGEGTLQPRVSSLAPTPRLLTAGAHGGPAGALARLGAGGRPPALVAGAVTVHWVAVAVAGALAGVLTQGAPAVGVAGAFTCDGVAAAVGVTATHLTTVRGPEVWGTACDRTKQTLEYFSDIFLSSLLLFI